MFWWAVGQCGAIFEQVWTHNFNKKVAACVCMGMGMDCSAACVCTHGTDCRVRLQGSGRLVLRSNRSNRCVREAPRLQHRF